MIKLTWTCTCDVCNEEALPPMTFGIILNGFGPTQLPNPPVLKTMGSRVLCDRCWQVLDNVAAAIAPGMLKPEPQPEPTITEEPAAPSAVPA